ncbi:MAG: heme NO-binding protein [Acetobacteraceae bacterium]|nr:MAG: heme NO-binding protein [Acetobacteraceae bacterium]
MRARLADENRTGSDMDALLLRSLQSYVIDMFGLAEWQNVCRRALLAVETFEPMLRYDPGTADRIALVVGEVLGRSVDTIWEDVGTYLVTYPDRESVRRLLRLGGTSYADFLHSLEELPGRARLAMPHLEVPEMSLNEVGPDRFVLSCQSHLGGLQRVLVGLLTAMADDYGALCLIEPQADGRTWISVLDRSHSEARQFDLAMREG